MANKKRMVGKKRKGNNNKKHFLKRKEEARNVNEQRDKDWIHVIRVLDTTYWANNNTAEQKTLANRAARRNERSR